MSGYKAGLHKKISTIFDGIPVQKQNGDVSEPGTKLPDNSSESKNKDVSGSQNQVKQTDNQQQLNQNGQRLYKDTAGKKYKLNAKNRQKGIFQNLIGKLKEKLLPQGSNVNLKRQIALIIAIPILCIILVVFYVRVFSSGPKKKGSTLFTPTQTASASDSGDVKWQVPKPLSADLRDPMRAGSTTGQGGIVSGPDGEFISGGEIIVMGIVHSIDKHMAIIGQQIVNEGDQIEGVKILKITERTVEVEKSGQTKTLGVGQKWLLPK